MTLDQMRQMYADGDLDLDGEDDDEDDEDDDEDDAEPPMFGGAAPVMDDIDNDDDDDDDEETSEYDSEDEVGARFKSEVRLDLPPTADPVADPTCRRPRVVAAAANRPQVVARERVLHVLLVPEHELVPRLLPAWRQVCHCQKEDVCSCPARSAGFTMWVEPLGMLCWSTQQKQPCKLTLFCRQH